MREFLRQIPIPTGGVALGLAALGILIAPLSPAAYAACGIAAFALLLLLAGRVATSFSSVKEDFENPILASVSATSLMAIMQLSTYAAPFAPLPALTVWACAVTLHAVLMVWFTAHHLRDFDLPKVYPTYFICYVGIVVASVTSPTYGLEMLGAAIFWFGFALYAVMLVLVTTRYIKHPVEEGARPLFCIYTAPMSLSLAGYLATHEEPNLAFVAAAATLAQALLAVVLLRLPRFLRLRFYPSYAAMTFPFVITASALGKALAAFEGAGVAAPQALHVLASVETGLACAMVAYVFARYVREFVRMAAESLVSARGGENDVADVVLAAGASPEAISGRSDG